MITFLPCVIFICKHMTQFKEQGIWSQSELNNSQNSVSYKPMILKNYVTSLNLTLIITVTSRWILSNVCHSSHLLSSQWSKNIGPSCFLLTHMSVEGSIFMWLIIISSIAPSTVVSKKQGLNSERININKFALQKWYRGKRIPSRKWKFREQVGG